MLTSTFPGGLAAAPTAPRAASVAQRVHALPEPVVAVRHQLPVAASRSSGSRSHCVSSPSM